MEKQTENKTKTANEIIDSEFNSIEPDIRFACQSCMDRWAQQQNEKLSSENKVLREALKPFAEMFGELTEQKIQQGGIVYSYNKADLTVNDFYNANAALNNKQ